LFAPSLSFFLSLTWSRHVNLVYLCSIGFNVLMIKFGKAEKTGYFGLWFSMVQF
jgi:hypothetical protein